MIFFTADQHYYHHNMLMFRFNEEQQRLFKTTDEMHRVLRKRHNERVEPNDTVYHLGDFAYGPGAKSWTQIQALLQGLNGTHHLILGNHDHIDPFKYVEAGFASVHTSLTLPLELPECRQEITLIHDPACAGVLTDKRFIHGHTHSLGKRLNDNTYCVCVELTDYYPVALTEISFREE